VKAKDNREATLVQGGDKALCDKEQVALHQPDRNGVAGCFQDAKAGQFARRSQVSRKQFRPTPEHAVWREGQTCDRRWQFNESLTPIRGGIVTLDAVMRMKADKNLTFIVDREVFSK